MSGDAPQNVDLQAVERSMKAIREAGQPQKKVPLTRRLQEENEQLRKQMEEMQAQFQQRQQQMQQQFQEIVNSRGMQLQQSIASSVEMIADCLYVDMANHHPDEPHPVDVYRQKLRLEAEERVKAEQEEQERLRRLLEGKTTDEVVEPAVDMGAPIDA